MPKTALIYKNIGETPLEALERFRHVQTDMCTDSLAKKAWQDVPMTYAGRLDPMAEGVLLILIGDECKNKEKYLNLDKEYEVEIVFGIETDTYDALGLAKVSKHLQLGSTGVLALNNIDFQKYVGKFTQEYPPYSSKTVDGKQLHELARDGSLPDKMPEKGVAIYSIDKLGMAGQIAPSDLKNRIFEMIDKVKGDFRQKEIKQCWENVLSESSATFPLCKIRVRCSSGTYMRRLAHKIGTDIGCGAFALTINRVRIFGV